jgi:Fe-S-cluster-containing dehydrogenase component
MACKVGNDLPDEDYRVFVRTIGNGAGVDRPSGVYPKLTMSWQPVFKNNCVFCASRVAEDKLPYCAYNCPTEALAFGEDSDPESAYSKALERVYGAGYRVYSAKKWEDTRCGVTYACRK